MRITTDNEHGLICVFQPNCSMHDKYLFIRRDTSKETLTYEFGIQNKSNLVKKFPFHNLDKDVDILYSGKTVIDRKSYKTHYANSGYVLSYARDSQGYTPLKLDRTQGHPVSNGMFTNDEFLDFKNQLEKTKDGRLFLAIFSASFFSVTSANASLSYTEAHVFNIYSGALKSTTQPYLEYIEKLKQEFPHFEITNKHEVIFRSGHADAYYNKNLFVFGKALHLTVRYKKDKYDSVKQFLVVQGKEWLQAVKSFKKKAPFNLDHIDPETFYFLGAEYCEIPVLADEGCNFTPTTRAIPFNIYLHTTFVQRLVFEGAPPPGAFVGRSGSKNDKQLRRVASI